MSADVLTKEAGDIDNILEVVGENTFRRANSEQNMVVFKDGEMMMKNTLDKNDELFKLRNLTKQELVGNYRYSKHRCSEPKLG